MNDSQVWGVLKNACTVQGEQLIVFLENEALDARSDFSRKAKNSEMYMMPSVGMNPFKQKHIQTDGELVKQQMSCIAPWAASFQPLAL